MIDRYRNAHRIRWARATLAAKDSGSTPSALRLARDFMMEWVRERAQLREERQLLSQVRAGHDVCWWADEGSAEPLVTILIPTYNRGRIVAERALTSAVQQTYQRLEILVVGDSADPATAGAVASVRDPRIRFENLLRRGLYPAAARNRWMVAGATPINVGHALARGTWIAPCDDDDELTPDHVELLLAAARSQRVEFVHSVADVEGADGSWTELGEPELREGRVSHGSVLYASTLGFMSFSTTSWKLMEPTDWNVWRRMQEIGVRIGYLPKVTYRHYMEGLDRDGLRPER